MGTDYLAITEHNITQLGLDTRSRRSQVTMYSDSTHFIFELLQNADDYGATEVSFELQPDRLLISHNGIPFAEENVKAITYFGRSTSAEDLVKTGRFGVGFKSVFAFTATPIIMSGEEHFQILDLYKLKEIPRPEGIDSRRTYITLPFNHEDYKPDYVENHISAKEAHDKIAARLTGLDKKTILFTKNIKTIRWRIGKRAGNYQRRDEIHPHFRYTQISEGKTGKTEHFMVFQKAVNLDGKEYKPVEVAFYQNKKRHIKGVTSLLYVLFPTIRTTNLKFLINGPFRTNPSRESIADDDPFNLQLIDLICDLWETILENLREEELLQIKTLHILPLDEDEVPTFFAPIQERIHSLLQEKAFLPAADGSFVSAKKAVIGPKAIREVFSNTDITLFMEENRKWLQGVSASSRAARLLQVIEVANWSWEELDNILQNRFQDPEEAWSREEESLCQKAMDWLSTRPNEWFQKFYILLGLGAEKDHFTRGYNYRSYEYTDLKFNDSLLIKLDSPDEVVFGSIANSRFPKEGYEDCLDPAILQLEDPKRVKEIRRSLERIGLKEVDEKDEIELLLEKYYVNVETLDDTGRSVEEHLQDIARFLRYFKNEKTVEPFHRYEIFLTETDEYIYEGGMLYIDEPFITTGLKALYEREDQDVENRVLLWSGYHHLIELGLVDFARSLGAQTGFSIKPCSVTRNPFSDQLLQTMRSARETDTGINQDYYIPKLGQLLALQSIELNLILWNTLREADPKVFIAKYRPNQEHRTNKGPSTLAHTLKTSAWIPDQNDQFYKPREITREQLHPDFICDNRSNWLNYLDFGKVDEFDESGKVVAEKIGVSTPQELNDWRAFIEYARNNNIPIEKIKTQFGMATNFPERPVAPVENREKSLQKTWQEYRTRSEKSYSTSERTVRSQPEKQKRGEYLKRQYTNTQGEMVCQLCYLVMPFKYQGAYYFEAVEILNSQYIPRDYYKQYLALCPNCAAKYKLFIKQNERNLEDVKYAIKDLIIAGEAGEVVDDPEITLPLDQEETLYFTEQHLIALQAILEDDE